MENRQARRSDLLRDYEPIVKLLERNAQGVEGWLQAYAGMDWTPEQERGFIAILVVHSLLPVGIIDLKIEDWKERISLAKLQAQAVDWSPMGRKPIWDAFAGQRDALETARVASAKAPLLQRVEAMITAALPGLGDLRKDYITRFKKVMHHKYALHYGRHQSTNPGGRVIANYGDIIHDGVSMLPPLQGWLDTKMGRDKSPGADRWGRLNAVIIDDGLDDDAAVDAAAVDPGEGEEIYYYDDNDGDATDPGDVQAPPERLKNLQHTYNLNRET